MHSVCIAYRTVSILNHVFLSSNNQFFLETRGHKVKISAAKFVCSIEEFLFICHEPLDRFNGFLNLGNKTRNTRAMI